MKYSWSVSRVVDPHLAFFLMADPDPFLNPGIK
jgi:hypothetical protein